MISKSPSHFTLVNQIDFTFRNCIAFHLQVDCRKYTEADCSNENLLYSIFSFYWKCNCLGLLHNPFLLQLVLTLLGITFQLFKLLCLAKDYWRGFNTRNAQMAHIVNYIRFWNVVYMYLSRHIFLTIYTLLYYSIYIIANFTSLRQNLHEKYYFYKSWIH